MTFCFNRYYTVDVIMSIWRVNILRYFAGEPKFAEEELKEGLRGLET